MSVGYLKFGKGLTYMLKIKESFMDIYRSRSGFGVTELRYMLVSKLHARYGQDIPIERLHRTWMRVRMINSWSYRKQLVGLNEKAMSLLDNFSGPRKIPALSL